MKAVILAAGIASRLRPLTDSMPKCLLQIGEKCLLKRTVEAVKNCNINELTIVTGYRANQIEDFLNENFKDLKITFVHNEVYDKTNNIYSLWLARKQVDNQDFILLDSDILFDEKVLKTVVESDYKNCLAMNRHELGQEEIKIISNNRCEVLEISKVCSINDAVGESVGIEKMSSEYSGALFEELQQMIVNEHLDNVFYEKAFERLISKNQIFNYVDTTDFFSIELDTVDDFNNAKKLITKELY